MERDREKDEAVVEDYRKGDLIQDIAIKHELCDNSIYRILKRNNVPLRPRREGKPYSPDGQKWDLINDILNMVRLKKGMAIVEKDKNPYS